MRTFDSVEKWSGTAKEPKACETAGARFNLEWRLLRAIHAKNLRRGHFRASDGLVFVHLRRERFGQAQLAAGDDINAPQDRGDWRFPVSVAEFTRGSFDALGARGFQLETQIDAVEVLVDVEQQEHRRDHAPSATVCIARASSPAPRAAPAANYRSASRYETPCLHRLVSSVSSLYLCWLLSAAHLLCAPQFRASRSRICFAALLRPGTITCLVSTLQRSGSLAFLKRVLHRAVFARVVTSAPPSGPRNLLWRGSEKETARVPPSLDSPLSAAPETFLLRDAVSAFPIASGPLPQPLPGARYPVSAALSRSPLAILLESCSSASR